MPIEFITGAFIGALIGITLMCLVQINSKSETRKILKNVKTYCKHKKKEIVKIAYIVHATMNVR